jgi:hypothetical protein
MGLVSHTLVSNSVFRRTGMEIEFPFPTDEEIPFKVILHGQSSRPNTGPCQTKLPKQPLLYTLLH